jgi:hypothetical protein
MALRVNGQEEGSRLPSELQHFRNRDITWLENYLRRKGAPLHGESAPRFSVEREINIIRAISADPHSPFSAGGILQAHQEALIPLSYLEWIPVGNGRLQIWLLAQAWRDLVNLPSAGTRWTNNPINPEQTYCKSFMRDLPKIPSHERKDEIVRVLDFWGAPLELKKEWINHQKLRWGELIKFDKRYVNWLKKTDKKTGIKSFDNMQLEWALGYLKDHNQEISVPPPTSTEETYDLVTAIIDGISSTERPAEKTVFIDTMKKAWSQKKYRDAGKAKKPYHLPLTIDVKRQLDWLVDKSGYRATDILAELIKMEYERVKGGKRCVIDEKSGT